MNIFELQKGKTPLELQAEKTLAAIKKYQFEKFDRHVKMQTFPEKMYELFENIWYSDKTYQYQENVVTLLTLLLKPDVMNVLRKELSPIVQDDITQMLLNLYSFFRSMSDEYYQLQIAKVEVDYCNDIEKLKQIEATYNAKFTGCIAEQQDRVNKYLNGHHLKIVDNE